MRWSEAIARPTDRKLREFAAAGAVVSIAIASYSGYQRYFAVMGVWAAFALAVAVCGFSRPRWLAPLFYIAMVATFPIAWIVSWLVVAALFYGVIVPIGVLLRLQRRDVLKQKLAPTQDSYWEPKPTADSPRRYLRQY